MTVKDVPHPGITRLERFLWSSPRRSVLTSVLWLALICWLAFFHQLGSVGLLDKTEALFVEVGRQMLERGDWITPWWNGERFFDYPAFGFWAVALSFRLFGVSEWAARLPVALAASSVVVAVFGLLLAWAPTTEPPPNRFGRAALGAGVLATCPGWIGWGRASTTDMFLSASISLALFGFLLAHRRPADRFPAAAGRIALALFCGVAVLAKGPIGVLLPGLVIVVFLGLTREWSRWLRPGALLAMALLFVGVCLPWYAAATRINGSDFLWGFLGFSNLQRFTSVIYDHPGPPWFYLPWLLLLALPWSLFLPVAIGSLRFWRIERWRPRGATGAGQPAQPDPLPLFLLLWLVLMLAFFSAAATKLPGYILPALPAAALLVALHWRPLPDPDAGSSAIGRRITAGLEAALLTLMAIAAALAPRWVAGDPAYPEFGAALRRSGLPLTLAAILILSALALIPLLRGAGRDRWLWVPSLAAGLAVAGLVVAPLAPLLDRERQLPLRRLAERSRLESRAGEPLWIVGSRRYSVLFYSRQPAAFVSGRKSIEKRLRHDPGTLGVADRRETVRLMGDRSELTNLGLSSDRITILARQGEQELWRVPIHAFHPTRS